MGMFDNILFQKTCPKCEMTYMYNEQIKWTRKPKCHTYKIGDVIDAKDGSYSYTTSVRPEFYVKCKNCGQKIPLIAIVENSILTKVSTNHLHIDTFENFQLKELRSVQDEIKEIKQKMEDFQNTNIIPKLPTNYNSFNIHDILYMLLTQRLDPQFLLEDITLKEYISKLGEYLTNLESNYNIKISYDKKIKELKEKENIIKRTLNIL